MRFQNTKLKYTQRVLKEMCKLVKVDYNKINFHKPNWFLKYSWDNKTEDKFKKWMIKYLSTNKKAREEIMNLPIKDIKSIKRTVDYFILNHGWKYKR